MYPVSQAFIDAVRGWDPRFFVKAVIDYTSPSLDQSIQVHASEQADTSYPVQTADGLTEPYAKYAALDGSWVLGEGWALAPGPDEAQFRQMGWWGSRLAQPMGGIGAFTSPFPMLTVTFASRPIRSLLVVGDSKRGEYPIYFVITLYDAFENVLHTETVTGNTQVRWEKNIESVSGVVKAVLEIRYWSHPYRQVKILEFFTSIQETYDAADIMSISLLEESESDQGSLPVGNISANEITLTLNNESKKFDPDNDQSPLYNLLKANRRIRLWLGVDVDGTVEWVPLGVFWALDWDSPSDVPETTVTGRDKLEALRKTTYQSSQVQQNVSLYTLAEQVLQDAGLTPEEYAIDEALQSIVIPYAWLNPMSHHREALRLIAEAALATAYADREGKIRVDAGTLTPVLLEKVCFIQGAAFPAEVTVPDVYGIGPDDYFTLRAPSRQDGVANQITVTTQPLRPAAVAEEVYRSNEPVSIPGPEDEVIADSQVNDNSSVPVYGASFWQAGKFTALASATNMKVKVRVSKTGSPPGDLQVHIYSENSSGNPGNSIGSKYISKDEITTEANHEVEIAAEITQGGNYFVVLRTDGGEALHCYRWYFESGIGYRYYSSSGGTTWLSYSGSMWFSLVAIIEAQTVTVTVQYNSPPVIEAAASLDSPPEGVSIVSAAYYGWGAEVTIQNENDAEQEANLVVNGKPLTVQNQEQVTARDDASITENGPLGYSFPDNPLVQTLAQAQAIADALLASYKDSRRDVELDWRGNPALELGDIISVITDVENDRRSTYAITRQEIEFAGALSARLTGRRV